MLIVINLKDGKCIVPASLQVNKKIIYTLFLVVFAGCKIYHQQEPCWLVLSFFGICVSIFSWLTHVILVRI